MTMQDAARHRRRARDPRRRRPSRWSSARGSTASLPACCRWRPRLASAPHDRRTPGCRRQGAWPVTAMMARRPGTTPPCRSASACGWPRAAPCRAKLFAAMAQQDCGQCGYLCETYSAAIAAGTESKLNLCVPGGKDTSRMLKQLLEEVPALPCPPLPSLSRLRSGGPAGEALGYGRDRPVEAIFRSAARLNGEGSEKDTRHVVLDISGTGLTLCTGRQLRPLSEQRSARWPTRSSRQIARAGRFSGRRQDHAAGADRGLCAWDPRRTRCFELIGYVAGGERRRKKPSSGARARTRMATPPRSTCWPPLESARADPSRPGGVPGMPGAAAAPALFHLLLAAVAPGEIHLTVDAVRYDIGGARASASPRRSWPIGCAPGARVKLYLQKAHGFALPDDATQADHHGRARHRHRAVPLVPVAAARR